MKLKLSVVFLVCILGTITSEPNLRTIDAEASGSLPDLHDTQFCTDVSEWTKVTYVDKTITKCDTIFNKDRKARRKTVCDNVTELKCDILPYTECELKMVTKPTKAYRDTKVPYPVKGCNETTDKIEHTKQVPHCVDETKLNCVTLWETDQDGNKVWAGNEDCEEVTWKKCELRDEIHEFTVPKLECGDTGEIITWEDCEEYQEPRMAIELTCNVLHTTKCEPNVREICRDIEYDEWFEQPEEECRSVTIRMPNQTIEHKERCLFHGNGNGGAPESKHGHHEHHQDHHEHHQGHHEHHSGHRNRRRETSVRKHIGRRRSASPDQATSSQKLPLHPSLIGFELHRQRHGKSVNSNITVIYPLDNNQIAESPDKNSAILERNTGKNPYWRENKASPVQTFHIGKKIPSNDKLAQLLNVEILKLPPKDNQKKVLRREPFKGAVQEITK